MLAIAAAVTILTALPAAVAPGLPSDPSVPTSIAVEGPPLFPLAGIKPGLRGKGYTVFSSLDGPEPFEFVVLGVMKSALGPGEDIIIVRLIGEKIEKTGVISGMSGSPAYIDGKLVGAVGYRFGQFTREPIAGITPIERMMTASARPSTSPARTPPAGASSAFGDMSPIGTPLVMAGVAPHIVDAFRSELVKRGFGPVVSAGGGNGSSMGRATRFFAGGPIAGVLVDGDMSMSAIGTVTWVKGDRFLAFGHPFMGLGAVDIVASNAEIITTVASEAGSWKMGQATAAVGRLTDDRLHAIAGDLGSPAGLIPMTVKVQMEGPRALADARPESTYRVAQHPTDTPMFCAVAVANAISARVGAELGGTLDVTVTAQLSTGEQVSAPLRFADDTAGLEMPAAFAVLDLLSRLTDNDFQKVELKSVQVDARGRRAVERARLVSVTPTRSLSPGGRSEVVIRTQPFQGPVKEQRVSFSLPRGVPEGGYSLVVAGADGAARVEREAGMVPIPSAYRDVLTGIATAPPPGSLSVYLVREESSPRLQGIATTGLPPSLSELTAGSGGLYGAGSVDARAVRLARISGSGVLVGEAAAKVQVQKP